MGLFLYQISIKNSKLKAAILAVQGYNFNKILYLEPSWLNWIEHWVSTPAATGSNPVEGTITLRRTI